VLDFGHNSPTFASKVSENCKIAKYIYKKKEYIYVLHVLQGRARVCAHKGFCA